MADFEGRSSFRDRVHRLVLSIPSGQVATYGQIARLLGSPRAAREVGWALRDLPDDLGAPWQRVINSQGRISFPEGSQGHAVQRALLEGEGVRFEPDGRIDLKVYGWEGLDPVERHEMLEDRVPGDLPRPQQLSLEL